MPGRRAVLYANNDDAYPLAASLAAAGVAVTGLVDPRPEAGEGARRLVAGMPLYSGHDVVATAGYMSLRRVWVRPVGGRSTTAVDCDMLAVSAGWNPTVQLFAQAQGRLRYDERLATYVPAECEAAVECAGAARGSFG